MSGRLSWTFHTLGVGTLSALAAVGSYLPHLYPSIDIEAEDLKREPSEEIISQLRSVYADLKRGDPAGFEKYKFYLNTSAEVKTCGSTAAPQGVYVGFPETLFDTSLKRIRERTVRVYEETVNWRTPASTYFAESLLLSEDARKFALAHVFESCEDEAPLKRSSFVGLGVPVCLLFTHLASIQVVRRRGAAELPRMPWYLGMVMCASVVSYLYVFSSLRFERKIQLNTDAKLIRLGPSYIQGGIDMCRQAKRQMHFRNVIFREISVNKYQVDNQKKTIKTSFISRARFETLRLREAALKEALTKTVVVGAE